MGVMALELAAGRMPQRAALPAAEASALAASSRAVCKSALRA